MRDTKLIEPMLLTSRQAAAKLGISIDSLRRLVADRKITARRRNCRGSGAIGRLVFFMRDLEIYCSSLETTEPAPTLIPDHSPRPMMRGRRRKLDFAKAYV